MDGAAERPLERSTDRAKLIALPLRILSTQNAMATLGRDV